MEKEKEAKLVSELRALSDSLGHCKNNGQTSNEVTLSPVNELLCDVGKIKFTPAFTYETIAF